MVFVRNARLIDERKKMSTTLRNAPYIYTTATTVNISTQNLADLAGIAKWSIQRMNIPFEWFAPVCDRAKLREPEVNTRLV
jgi:hypothetical protein